jgi:protein-S-isoprenylcysteine O-methyltransferase Ste14
VAAVAFGITMAGLFSMWEKIPRLIYKVRGLLMAPMIVFMALCTWREIENNALVFSSGGIVFGLGWCLRVWSQMHLHYRLKIHKILTTTGPYVYIRNPCYVANMLMLMGVTFLSELLWFAPLMLVYCAIVYNFVVRYEEAKLIKKYGTLYVDYFTRVPRWFPRLRGFPRESPHKMREFMGTSILSEIHNLLLIVPFLIKEMLH